MHLPKKNYLSQTLPTLTVMYANGSKNEMEMPNKTELLDHFNSVPSICEITYTHPWECELQLWTLLLHLLVCVIRRQCGHAEIK